MSGKSDQIAPQPIFLLKDIPGDSEHDQWVLVSHPFTSARTRVFGRSDESADESAWCDINISGRRLRIKYSYQPHINPPQHP
jgi:hypothetical protein